MLCTPFTESLNSKSNAAQRLDLKMYWCVDNYFINLKILQWNKHHWNLKSNQMVFSLLFGDQIRTIDESYLLCGLEAGF